MCTPYWYVLRVSGHIYSFVLIFQFKRMYLSDWRTDFAILRNKFQAVPRLVPGVSREDQGLYCSALFLTSFVWKWENGKKREMRNEKMRYWEKRKWEIEKIKICEYGIVKGEMWKCQGKTKICTLLCTLMKVTESDSEKRKRKKEDVYILLCTLPNKFCLEMKMKKWD